MGDTSSITEDELLAYDSVKTVRRIKEAYKLANREAKPEDTVVETAGRKIGGGHFQVIAGPCSIESKEQMTEVARAIQKAGAGSSGAALLSQGLRRIPSRDLGRTGFSFFWRRRKLRDFPL